MNDEKIFLTWHQQVKKLKCRNLTFKNLEEEKNAAYSLQNNSYYSLINGYKDIFCITDSNGDDDYQGEEFYNLRSSYDFDKELSSIIFKYLLQIEDSLKAIFSYHLGSMKDGHKDAVYLSEGKYRMGKYKTSQEKYERDILLEKLNKEIDFNYNPQMVHYRESYDYTPPWVLASCISLDTLLYWVKLSDTNVKAKTVDTFLYNYEHYLNDHFTDYGENIELFNNLFLIIKEYRNRAAHGNRIMNHVSNHNIKFNLLELYALNRASLRNVYRNNSLNRDIFSLFVSVTILLSKRSTVRHLFIDEVEEHFSMLKGQNSYLYEKVMKSIKLPENFADLLRGIVC